ncbi:hypothetical protein [Pseudonocardia sp. TRM90224]|uniref:hypothetical protein n=1 Tax=Pseudonocardia sp. TRM90224 TaxID=2812678 RepID=UPI001E2C21E9|nr:hypothetical protein [Pseudonocardia sp. TRM90224]
MSGTIGAGTRHNERTSERVGRHPLPWQNEPSGGNNHVSDANGRAVYDGCDAAEMFRLYGDEVRAERAERHAGVGRRRGRGSRPS